MLTVKFACLFCVLAYFWRIFGVLLACTYQKNAVTLHRIFKCITMNILGGIGLAAAIANYRKANKDYNEALERVETLQAAVDTYISQRDAKFDELNSGIQFDKNIEIPGVLCTSILRIGNLVGNYCRVRTSVVLTNTGSAHVTITSVEANVYACGTLIVSDTENKRVSYFKVEPGETKEIELPGGIASVDGATIDAIKSAICQTAGKRLITSCPKTNVSNIEQATVRLKWKAASGAGDEKEARYTHYGVLRYCGEAYYPDKK